MALYEQAWKLFRRLSNENEVTAEHLLSRPLWPRGRDITLVDVGCGDGLLTQRLVLISRDPVVEVRLLDPDPDFLQQAHRHIAETGVVPRIEPCLGRAEATFAAQHCGADVVLAVHVVYLLADNSLAVLIDLLPVGVPLYVVLDAPDSIFARLWRRTAPKYYRRSTDAHAMLRSLPRGRVEVTPTTISSKLENPLEHPQQPVMTGLLSLLSYADLNNMADSDREWVREQIRGYVIGDHVHCESTCYEIRRTS